MTIFTIMILVASDIFQTGLTQQRSILTKNSQQNTFRYALEVFNKDLKSAQRAISSDWCLGSDYDFKIFKTPVNGNPNSIAFLDKNQNCTVYYLASSSLMVARVAPPGSTSTPTSSISTLTPNDIVVQDFKVRVDSQAFMPASVTYQLTFRTATSSRSAVEKYVIQSTVAVRYYD